MPTNTMKPLASFRKPPPKAVASTVQFEASTELASVQVQLNALARLEVGWDTYGASPVELSSLAQAYDLLQSLMADETPAPTLVPTATGGIQIEWHTLGVELEVSLRPDANLDVYFEDLRGIQEPFDDVLSNGITTLTKLMRLLASRARDAKRA